MVLKSVGSLRGFLGGPQNKGNHLFQYTERMYDFFGYGFYTLSVIKTCRSKNPNTYSVTKSYQMGVCGLISVSLWVPEVKKFEKHCFKSWWGTWAVSALLTLLQHGSIKVTVVCCFCCCSCSISKGSTPASTCKLWVYLTSAGEFITLISLFPIPCCAELDVSLWGATRSEPVRLTLYILYFHIQCIPCDWKWVVIPK